MLGCAKILCTDMLYAISVTAPTNGTISPGSVSLYYGQSQTYAITANSGYSITDVTVDGVSQGAVSTYAFGSVSASHTIAATFSFVPTWVTPTGYDTFSGDYGDTWSSLTDTSGTLYCGALGVSDTGIWTFPTCQCDAVRLKLDNFTGQGVSVNQHMQLSVPGTWCYNQYWSSASWPTGSVVEFAFAAQAAYRIVYVLNIVGSLGSLKVSSIAYHQVG